MVIAPMSNGSRINWIGLASKAALLFILYHSILFYTILFYAQFPFRSAEGDVVTCRYRWQFQIQDGALDSHPPTVAVPMAT